jgi:hypothetical protein
MRARLAARPELGAVFGRIRVKVEPGAVQHQGYAKVDGRFIPNGILGTGLFRHSTEK